jgi:hypothetical protein
LNGGNALRVHWLEHDMAAFVALIVGMAAVELLALIV